MNRIIIPAKSIDAEITLPGSKYIANRLLPMCALATTPSQLKNVVINNDINAVLCGLTALGYQIDASHEKDTKAGLVQVNPRQNPLELPVTLNTEHSGTFSRFVSALAALESVPISIECSSKMATRPMAELFSSLRALGVTVESDNDCLPATIIGPVTGHCCELDASRSSQYLSGLLIVAPLLANGLQIKVAKPIVSRAYVDMTIQLMSLMGVQVIENQQTFTVKAGQQYQGINYTIPGDPVSASYFMAAAAISGGKVTINHFDFNSLQGESQFYSVLQNMGVKIEIQAGSLTVTGPKKLKSIEVDMSEMPDAVQTLAAVACFAEGITHIKNIAHLAYKESNRIEDTAIELRKTGIRVDSGKDFLTIYGGKPHSGEINTHDDHRMAMSMALLGIKTPDIKIMQASVVEKSFPNYWQCLAHIGVNSRTTT